MNIGHYSAGLLVSLILAESVIISFLLKYIESHLVKFKLSSKALEYLKMISPTTIILFTLYVVNNFLWKYPLINPILIDVPVIEGNYEGSIRIGDLSDLNKRDSSNVTVQIRQTGTSTYVKLVSPKGSISESMVTDFVKKNEEWTLIFYYFNENQKTDGRNRYEGATKWKIQMEKGKKIKIVGRFFTDETRKTYGTVELEKVD